MRLQMQKLTVLALQLEMAYIIFLHLTEIIKFRTLQTTMNNQSIKAASPLPLKCTSSITPPGLQQPFLKRIIEVLVDVIPDRLAHPVQSIMTCWMYDATLFVTTILNMSDELIEGQVIL